jgi:hypothetical protein
MSSIIAKPFSVRHLDVMTGAAADLFPAAEKIL